MGREALVECGGEVGFGNLLPWGCDGPGHVV